MSFLTPWFLAAGLAIAFPIVFHMIRRTPKGRVPFSTLMFLTPSPPRITRRSNIEHWLLLLMRALAVLLLAFAFARPFLFNSELRADTDGERRLLVLLVDVSGSMQREGLWDAALEQSEDWFDDVQPGDSLAVMTFDDKTRTLISFAGWNELPVEQRTAAALDGLRELQPGWNSTDLGLALRRASDDLLDESVDSHAESKEIVLLSDMQSGSKLDSLELGDWPDDVFVTILPLGDDASRDNASARPLAGARTNEAEGVLLRVDNAAASQTETFQVGWQSEFVDSRTGERAVIDPVTIYVPAGQSRVVTLPLPIAAGDSQPGTSLQRVVLSRDGEPFDNVCYVSPPNTRDLRVVCVGSSAATFVEDAIAFSDDTPEFYLPLAFSPTPLRRVTVTFVDPSGRPLASAETSHADAAPLELDGVHLVVCTAAPTGEMVATLQNYLAGGGTILAAPRDAPSARMVPDIMGQTSIDAGATIDITPEDFVVWTEMQFESLVLRVFDDPRYSDFSRLHFWQHRRLDPAWLEDAQVLARFDDGDPALLEWRDAAGGPLILLAAGWWPDDSDLARSTKFVPLLNSILDEASRSGTIPRLFHVGDTLDLAELVGESWNETEVVHSDADEGSVASASVFELDSPGVYHLRNAAIDLDLPIAVNLDPNESRIAPLDADVLEAAGIPLGITDAVTLAAREAAEESASRRELEAGQKHWRWLLLAAVVLLLAETWYAGHLSRRQALTAA